MAKRHFMKKGDWESIFGRLQELVMANSGEDEFEEIFKLVIAKLYSELFADGDEDFKIQKSPELTAQKINDLIYRATNEWKDIFNSAVTSNLTDEHLTICAETLVDHSLLDTNLEMLDGAFEFLISKTAKGGKGQFFTPRHVIECCVQIMDPKPEETVMDPACGSGGFLIHVLNHVKKAQNDFDVKKYTNDRLWGFDFDIRALRVAKALMLIAGDGHTNLFRLNSLFRPNSAPSLFSSKDKNSTDLCIEDVTRTTFRNFKGFDLILTNPPFAGEIKEQHILESYTLTRKGRRLERDTIFLERCVQLLKPGGRLAIVLPHNKFAADSWSYMREWLLRQMRVVGVLGLGRNTFLPHTHQKASVLFAIKREQPIRQIANEDVLFMLSEKDGKNSKGQIIPKSGSKDSDPIWLRADHDLTEIKSRFFNFAEKNNIPWGASRVTALSS